MTSSRLPLVALTALALVIAAPAAAVSAYPISTTLRVTSISLETKKAGKTAHTCQAGHDRSKSANRSGTDPRNPPPVACEQPPRSSVAVSGLSKAVTNAFLNIG
ncbi:MAG TPA: hypothetical protein VGM80_09645 [Gaiellaceae bacterium]|jgi:hypothetical protein